MIIIDPEAIYNSVYISITVYAFILPFAYSVLLFDIVSSSEDLKNVLMAIYLNLRNIFKFSFLGFSIMFIYGVIGWNFFREFYGDDGWTFLNTVTFTIKEGLRSGGGITEAISPPAPGDKFWARWAYDLSFFIIINMLFI
jgi:ryanodine receptor 2